MTKQSWMGGSIQISFKKTAVLTGMNQWRKWMAHLKMMNDGNDRWWSYTLIELDNIDDDYMIVAFNNVVSSISLYTWVIYYIFERTSSLANVTIGKPCNYMNFTVSTRWGPEPSRFCWEYLGKKLTRKRWTGWNRTLQVLVVFMFLLLTFHSQKKDGWRWTHCHYCNCNC